jgi:hypothetical protein
MNLVVEQGFRRGGIEVELKLQLLYVAIVEAFASRSQS